MSRNRPRTSLKSASMQIVNPIKCGPDAIYKSKPMEFAISGKVSVNGKYKSNFNTTKASFHIRREKSDEPSTNNLLFSKIDEYIRMVRELSHKH